jgi:hypothetical protein
MTDEEVVQPRTGPEGDKQNTEARDEQEEEREDDITEDNA